MYVSYSMLSSTKCPRYFWYIYVKKIFPRLKSLPFLAGDIWHQCIHMYFQGAPKKKILKHASSIVRALQKKQHPDKEYMQNVLIMEAYTRAALRGYFKLYRRDEFKIIAVEKRFEIVLADGTKLGGRIDEVIEDKHKDQWVKEFKFTSMMGEKGYVVRTAIDQQVSIYYLAQWRGGKKPRGILYDMALKPYKKPLMHETMLEYEERMTQDYKSRSDFYFKREELHRTKDQIKDLKNDLLMKVKRLAYMKANNLYDKETSVCNMYGLCEYFPLCANPKSSRNKLMFTKERS